MQETWATFGVDLYVEPSGPGVRAGLEAALREAVRNGRLVPGSRLPSSRGLAAELGIARNTVASAYSQLIAEGWLTARQGSGTRVAETAATVIAATARYVPPSGTGRYRYDLRPGSPDLSAFPRTAWLAAARRALNAAPSAALGYGDAGGRQELRAALAAYLSRARGLRVTPDRIVVCNGFVQGLGLLCEVLRSRGTTKVAVESYGLQANVSVLRASGLAPLLLDIDDEGAVLNDAGDATAMLLTPAHQFPIGPTLSPRRRSQAVRWAAGTGGLIIEDDYDGEFRYDRQPTGALQGLAPEQVVYIGTASKTLAPGLRLGWLALPAGLADEVTAVKARTDMHTGVFEQLTFAEFIGSGWYDRHIRRSRLTYRHRRDQLAAVLARQAPKIRLAGIAAGLHVIAELPGGRSEDEVVAAAAREGLAVESLGSYALGSHTRGPALVIGYATPSGHAFSGAVGRLRDVLTAL